MIQIPTEANSYGHITRPEQTDDIVNDARKTLEKVERLSKRSFTYLKWAFIFLVGCLSVSLGFFVLNTFSKYFIYQMASYLIPVGLIGAAAQSKWASRNLKQRNPNILVLDVSKPETDKDLETLANQVELNRRTYSIDTSLVDENKIPPILKELGWKPPLEGDSNDLNRWEDPKDPIAKKILASLEPGFLHTGDSEENIKENLKRKAVREGLMAETDTLAFSGVGGKGSVKISTLKRQESVELFRTQYIENIDSGNKVAIAKMIYRYFPRKNKLMVITDYEPLHNGSLVEKMTPTENKEIKNYLLSDFGINKKGETEARFPRRPPPITIQLEKDSTIVINPSEKEDSVPSYQKLLKIIEETYSDNEQARLNLLLAISSNCYPTHSLYRAYGFTGTNEQVVRKHGQAVGDGKIGNDQNEERIIDVSLNCSEPYVKKVIKKDVSFFSSKDAPPIKKRIEITSWYYFRNYPNQLCVSYKSLGLDTISPLNS